MGKKLPGFLQSIVDIPLALKGFPMNLRKKPPKNKKELDLYLRVKTAYMWLGLPLVIIGLVLMLIGGEMLYGIGMIVALAGFMFIVFMFYKKNNVKNGGLGDRIIELTCPACEEMITFDQNVRYKVVDVSWSAGARKRPMSYGSNMEVVAEGTEITKVEITCKCQKHTFTKSFETGNCRKKQRDVPRYGPPNNPHYNADMLVAQFSNEIREVSRAVFENGGSGKNNYGISVKRYDIAKCIADYCEVKYDMFDY